MTNEKHKCHLGLHMAKMKYIVITFSFKILNNASTTYLNLVHILRLYTILQHTRYLIFAIFVIGNIFVFLLHAIITQFSKPCDISGS